MPGKKKGAGGHRPKPTLPTKISARPLNEKDQDDRVRIALGLTSNDPLPEVDDDTLLAYHRYLQLLKDYGSPQKLGGFGERRGVSPPVRRQHPRANAAPPTHLPPPY